MCSRPIVGRSPVTVNPQACTPPCSSCRCICTRMCTRVHQTLNAPACIAFARAASSCCCPALPCRPASLTAAACCGCSLLLVLPMGRHLPSSDAARLLLCRLIRISVAAQDWRRGRWPLRQLLLAVWPCCPYCTATIAWAALGLKLRGYAAA